MCRYSVDALVRGPRGTDGRRARTGLTKLRREALRVWVTKTLRG